MSTSSGPSGWPRHAAVGRKWTTFAPDLRAAFASAGEKPEGRSPPFVHLTGSTFAWQFIVVVHALRTGGHMITELKSVVEGVYILDEWNIDEKTFRPPAVEGRFVISKWQYHDRFNRYYARN